MKRYDTLLTDENMFACEYLSESPDGGWVRYEDAVTEINNLTGTLTDECARLRAENENLLGYANPLAEARGVSTDGWETACRNVNKLLGETELARKLAESDLAALRETSAEVMQAYTASHSKAYAAESSLAAATALAESVLAVSYAPTWLKEQARAFLANQPAAPSCVGRGCPRDGECPEHGRNRPGQCVPAAPVVYHSRPGSNVFVPDQPAAPGTGNKPPYSSSGHAIQYAHPSTYRVEPFEDDQPAASSLGHPGADEVFARLRAARQPAELAKVQDALTRTEAEQSEMALYRETLERIQKHTEAHAFTTRDWFRSVFAELARRGPK